MATKKKLKCHGQDVLSRMNFLYQASLIMAERNKTLSVKYGNLCKIVAKKAVLRMDPNIKRTLCRRCGIALKPDTTAELSSDSKNDNIIHLVCCKCEFSVQFRINSKYKLWLENESCIVESYS